MASDSQLSRPKVAKPLGDEPHVQNAPAAGDSGPDGNGKNGSSEKTPAKSAPAKLTTAKSTTAKSTTAKSTTAKSTTAKRKKPLVAKPLEDAPEGRPAAESLAEKQPVVESAAKVAEAESADQAESSEDEVLDGHQRFLLLNAVPSWMISMILHAVILLVLALLTLPEDSKLKQILTVAQADPDTEAVEEFEEDSLEFDPVDVESLTPQPQIDLASMVPQDETNPKFDDLEAAPATLKLEDFGAETAPKTDLISSVGAVSGAGLEGRGSAARAQMVRDGGGSEGSERAVALALRWFAEHQNPDGSWSFNHQTGPCQARCSRPGMLPEARNGATAMALLPFLGAGQTHKEGKYKQTVERGLYFLLRSMKVRNQMGDLTDRGGRMYAHGLCAITLCEAYAMTNDRWLMQPAQASLNYIVWAQDPVGGGWRYGPQQPGDTSVVGWQLMALKSGHMAYLTVPGQTILGSNKFLDSVSSDSGAKYGYTAPGGKASTTAVGLLCRMYLGWKKTNPALERGVDYLSGIGPTTDMYYNYYATQVMRHFGGEPWKKWNSQMRDRLVKSQDQEGHQKGSWFLPGGHGSRAGRLYCTSMATMILEVYYRHMPIYGKAAAEEDFPL